MSCYEKYIQQGSRQNFIAASQYLEQFDERLQVNIPFKCDIVNYYRIVVRILFQIKGGRAMFKYYITEFKNWLDNVIPAVIDEKNFLYIMGSLFLLGIVTKWIVLHSYGKLIRRAENMQSTKNATIRQIKNKYESMKQVNGTVVNPMLFVQRHLNKCKAGYISLNKLNNIINYCEILMIGLSGSIGLELYVNGSGKTTAMSYILVGCFFGFALEMIDRSIKVDEKKMELTYVIADYLENGVKQRNTIVENEAFMDNEEAFREKNMGMSAEEMEKVSENARDEQILNQVIGEFLQ